MTTTLTPAATTPAATIALNVAIISHTPTTEQGDWTLLPPELKGLWGAIPPNGDLSDVFNYIMPIYDWLETLKPKISVIWCQGEMSATALIWQWCRRNGVKPVVATTERVSVETTEPDGSVVKKAVFKHCRFREIPML